ncbi:uncharacterized protein K452DRAFT_350326 [Aplosporella prunicola CBS 121167]|uniref:MYND-type domain-containing protein n=1 Tax=Aplosporella prunicola CBS 121167 TaxID=1176127 RepID=A0A6A6BGF1_9PEZI|nr:uncharacterized protein K452DRAFT_350326 [Aplosporella prunicola CBS 121167]KAF2143219.1 hypothetical protein K452DRAFT_350326 [Aplosporella prunicola CBS 121167]
MADTNGTNPGTCSTCKKASPDLKRCAKCHTEQYCNRDCQKAHWKTHKKVCAMRAGQTPNPSTSTPGNAALAPKNLDTAIAQPFHCLDDQTWLHGRSERDTYKLLIDSYRIRMNDQYNMEGDIDNDCVMSGNVSSSIRGFERYLRLLHRRAPNLLPPWWNSQKEQECKSAGMRSSAWESLSACPEKSDFIEHYGDSMMPMQLRMFNESVYGNAPGGSSGEGMRKMMMMQEAGAIQTSLLT